MDYDFEITTLDDESAPQPVVNHCKAHVADFCGAHSCHLLFLISL